MVGGSKVTPGLDTSARIVPVQLVEVHSGYRSQSHENDINLLILSEPANVPPVAIATFEQIRAATSARLVGFGYNDPTRPLGFGTKRQVDVPMAPIVTLAETESLSALEAQMGFHAAYEFVAGRKGLGLDTCNGDSGGPAYLSTLNGYVLAGLTSRATRSATLPCGDGGVYVRPDKYVDWINCVLRRAGLPPLV
jgi:endonuclease G